MRNITVKGLGAGLAALTVFAYTASGQFSPVTYVDATHGTGGNTTMLDGSVWEPFIGQSGTTDGVWDFRDQFGNDGVYQNTEFGVADDAHPLRTSVSGLAEDEYDVFVYFWHAIGSDWVIRASLTENGELPLFDANTEGVLQFFDGPNGTVMSSNLEGGNPFDSDVMVAEQNRRLIQAHLGTFTGTEFSVFIDDGPSLASDGIDDRTWYDGIGYAVVPEPSTYALFLGLGVFGLLAIRRYRRKS